MGSRIGIIGGRNDMSMNTAVDFAQNIDLTRMSHLYDDIVNLNLIFEDTRKINLSKKDEKLRQQNSSIYR